MFESYRESFGEAAIRCSDLVVLGPKDDGDQDASDGTPAAELAITSGRPVLVIPQAPQAAMPGSRILVAWNGSREAMRAVSDAMPLLERAAFVELLSIQPLWSSVTHGIDDLSGPSQYLERHGVKVERFAVQAPEHMVGDQIVARARRADCDLIVMGAYGHSRVRELVLGGATRNVLKDLRQCVFMSH